MKNMIIYTTQARYDEREKQEYVYSLVFFDNKLIPKTTLPLTNKTDVDYELLFSFKTKDEFLNGL